MYDIKKKFKKSRMFLGTDILNLPLITRGEIYDILVDNARDNKLGVFLADGNQAYIIPAEFI